MHVKEEAGEPDRRAPPADECHVCNEDFKFLSVMDRFERAIVLVFDCRYFHYKRHYQEMAQRPFQETNHSTAEEKVLQFNKAMKSATQLILDPSRYFRHSNIGDIKYWDANIASMQIFQARCQRELQRLGRLVSRHRQISQGDPRLLSIKWQLWWWSSSSPSPSSS